ncbi:hypothetical protein GOD95_05085 [Paeniclostridium sordellii]|uniref:hypothetical protein n=1 Tax=Paraclostridium sordellii TaxID=1505 RepID=UPI0012ECD028|nr:hypothetical protein [Paeniclostridium sordellii]MVO70817.1 hypothetical protein [Paeniclostridium sordellii]
MENIILEFDKRVVSKEEMFEHLNHYSQKSEEGMRLCSDGNKKEAILLFREIMSLLKKESKYYDKSSIGVYTIQDKLYSTYTSAIREAYAKPINTNSYETLFSNLEDIHFQTNYYIDMFK